MSKTPKVSQSSMEEMIELVRQHPEIYDTGHPDHKDAVRTSNIWASITKKLAIDNPEMTGKWVWIYSKNVIACSKNNSMHSFITISSISDYYYQ